MKINIHQPNYLPGLSYFAKMALADVFVVLDTVQFSKNNWTNRNRIKGPNGAQWLTVPVLTKGKLGCPIKEMEVNSTVNWELKHWRAIQTNYARSPYYSEMVSHFEAIYKRTWTNICDLNVILLRLVAEILGIKTKILLASEMQMEEAAHSSELLFHLCQSIGGTEYISGPGGKNYLNENIFNQGGIQVTYIDYNDPVYHQLWGEFISKLSILDLLMNEGQHSFNILMTGAVAQTRV
ncbi:MAG: WbqC family protein [Firmicutes bacterium]|nr:WbqC family protein [Bacillota bacterium]